MEAAVGCLVSFFRFLKCLLLLFSLSLSVLFTTSFHSSPVCLLLFLLFLLFPLLVLLPSVSSASLHGPTLLLVFDPPSLSLSLLSS